jgi:aryl-alcohol dehydrogenase-like predicted oxidoreductase
MSPTSPPVRDPARDPVLVAGRPVHPVGVGGWPLGGPDHNLDMPTGWSTATDPDRLVAGLEQAFSLGANLIDTADVYGHGRSERLIGSVLRHLDRKRVVVCGKLGYFTGTAAHGYDPLHMRHQLEQSLANLQTDHLDVLAFHHHEFGDTDRHLEPALEAMDGFRRQGLIRAVGLRGPHRYAPQRRDGTGPADKHSRFTRLAERIRPDVLAVRWNLLTPAPPGGGIFAYAADRDIPVLLTKPLAQGLLTGKHRPGSPPVFGPGDHRSRKAWFTAGPLGVLDAGLDKLRVRFGVGRADLVRVALRCALQSAAPARAVALAGFTSARQAGEIWADPGVPLTGEEVAWCREVMDRVREDLDSSGAVFTDLPAPAR